MAGYDTIKYACLTDVGVRRSHNQDAHSALLAKDHDQWENRGHFFLVADGMGAHAVGELASKLAADIIPHAYSKHAHNGPVAALRKAFIEANLTIHNRGQQNREFEGMGTTGTALLIRPEGAWVGHVGDSRAYRVRAGQIEQMSYDHSLHWEMARRQNVSPSQLQGIPSNVIVRSLGPEPLVQVDIEGPHPVQDGDIFVLCSDGLSGPLSDHEIGAVVSVLPPPEACRFLVDLTNLRGGPDNITVIIVQVSHAGQDGAGVPAQSRPRRPWHERISWPFASLSAGVILATIAVTLTYHKLGGGLPTFLLAAAALVAGLVGLMITHKKEQLEKADQRGPDQIKLYSNVPCKIERAMVDKILKAKDVLEKRARDKQVKVDWTAFRRLHDLAAAEDRENALPEAFRDYCRSVSLLTEPLLKERNKEEAFHPVWDRADA